MPTSIVALLGTLRELHHTLAGYSLESLEALVAARKPDLLCVEVSRQDWEAHNLQQAPVETREVLARLSQASEITLVPIGAGAASWSEGGVAPPRPGGMLASWRRRMSRLLGRTITGLMKLAGTPRAVNSPLIEHLCGILCELQVWLADAEARRAWAASNQELLDGIVWTLRHDPGQRVLVALDCRRKHWLRRRLRSLPEVKVVDFWRF